jgi:uncharacterized membrane protein YoaK (UPF0700 family)
VAAETERDPVPAIFLVLTFIAGEVDAISYLQFDHTFVANITGNVVFAGFTLAGVSGGSKWSSSLIALSAFFLGAAFAGRFGRAALPRRILRAATAAQLVLVAAAWGFIAAGPPLLGYIREATVIALLSLAMGTQSAAARRADALGVPTVVLTTTLTQLAYQSGFGTPQKAQLTRRRIGSVVAMFVGAAAGAACVLRLGVAGGLGLTCAMLVAAIALTFSSSGTVRAPSKVAP